MEIVNLTTENAEKHSFFCIKNTKEPGFKAKQDWFSKQSKLGLTIKVIYADDGKLVGFIEYVPAEFAWRPVKAEAYLFIHCIFVYPNKYRSTGAASDLINTCINEAKAKGFKGVCTMTSQGPWIATKKLFAKQGFKIVDKSGRFELMAFKIDEHAQDPKLINWEAELDNYKGWHLLYTDQCPWHNKGVKAMEELAKAKGVELKIKKIESAGEAKKMPSGFGTFALVKDGRLLEDHYISKRRFESIIEKEMA